MYLDHEADVPAARRGKSEQAGRQALEARAPLDPEILRRWRDLDDEANESGRDVPAVIPVAADAKHHIDAEPVTTPRRRRLPLAGIALAIAAGAGGWFGYHWWKVGRFMVSTDDAYVQADNTTLAAKVAGYVANIYVADNSYVHAGDVIATIDDGDYRLAVDQARDKVATQQATVERIGRQIVAAEANVDQAKAQLVSAQAGSTRARLEADRQQALAVKQFASQQTLEQAVANRDQAAAGIPNAQAAVEAAQANVAVLKAQ